MGRHPLTRSWKDIKYRYGLTKDDFMSLHEKQGGKCAICGQPRRLMVDHCHTSGRVRGLLCAKCNTAIGYLGEDPGVMANAINYIKEQHDPPK